MPSFTVVIQINQGAVQLNTKLTMRPKALKSALDGESLKVFINVRSLAKVENYMQFRHIPHESAL